MAPSALPRTPRSLADDLRSRSAGQITRLLRARPDLLHPWPTDLGQLARRAADDASVLEAMQALTTQELRVLEVFACMHEASVADVVAALPDDEERVREAASSLWTCALIWGGPGTLRITRAAQQAFGPHPCGLAAAGHSGRIDEQAVRESAETVAPERLRTWVWSDPVSDQPHPLLVPRGEQWVLDRDVALLLREGQYLPEVPPPPRPVAVEPASGQSLWGPLAGVRYLLSDLEREPLALHATRGVSRRGVNDRAAAMSVPAEELMVWLELAAVAGLVGPSGDNCRPTPAARSWRHAPAAQMWSTLFGAWLDSDRPLGACVPEGLGCLTTATRPRAALHRRHILAVWPEAAAVGADEAREMVSWWRPRMHEAVDQVSDVMRELQVLGLLDAGLPTSALAHLPDDVAGAAASLPGPEAGGLIIQPDQTVIAPLAVDTATWDLLQSVAHVESWGPVTMQRVDPARVRAAVAGRDPQEILSALRAASRTPLPQALEYVVLDAARTSPARIYAATVVEVAAADVDTLLGLGLSQIGPGVFASDLSAPALARMLDAAGVAATTRQEPVLAVPLDRTTAGGVPDEATVARVVEHLLGSAEPVQLSAPPLAHADPEALAGAVRTAIVDQRRLWVQYPDTGGTRTDLVEPIDLRSGNVTGWSLSAGRMITVPLSKIAAFGSADD